MSSILSVGIDVGTTSTHLTFTRLRLANSSKINEPARMIVASREILYQSPIYFTPLLDDVIDAERVVQILREEYVRAAIAPEEVATGAVIITGETAKKRNAEAIVKALSELAGNFVSASAGPSLESILAARGSGACEASLDGSTVINIDVGGGTTNIAVCRAGQVVDTMWLPIGGRVVLADEAADAASRVLDLVKTMDGALYFSGGVAEIMLRLDRGEDVDDDEFGDNGVRLARALLKEVDNSARKFYAPPNAIRATVIGAGAYSLQLSGSTVAIRNTALPLRDLPIVILEGTDGISKRLRALEIDWSHQSIALMFPDLQKMGYEELKRFASSISETIGREKAKPPYIILMRQDMAAALGQLLHGMLPGAELVVLDGIATAGGDFIDVGKPMSNGQFVPVVVKEFVFTS